MIKTMYEFGVHLKEIEDMKPYFAVSASPYREKARDELVIIAEIVGGRYERLTSEQYRRSYDTRYLFRDLAGARSTSIVPTLHFYFIPKEDKLDESIGKFLDKLGRCLTNNEAVYKLFFDPKQLLEGVEKDLKRFVQEHLSEPKNYLFTLQIDDKWLGDIPEIKSILEQSSYDKYFRDGKGDLFRGENRLCAVTYVQAPEVWGRVDTLGFTVNDIAFSRNGFEAKDSYKMFPVSPEAVKILEGTRRTLDSRLSKQFLSMRFFVLPHFVTIRDDFQKKDRLVRRFVEAIIAPTEPGFDPMARAIVNSEDIFDKILKDPELGHNSVYYDIFFYEQKQAQFLIKLHISDVIPSRFRIIMDVKNRIKDFYQPLTRREFKDGKEIFVFSPSFYNIKDYFSIKREKETIVEPYFFKIVEAVFYKNRLDREQVLRAFMQKIVPAFKNQSEKSWEFQSHVKHSFCIYQFFQQLQPFLQSALKYFHFLFRRVFYIDFL